MTSRSGSRRLIRSTIHAAARIGVGAVGTAGDDLSSTLALQPVDRSAMITAASATNRSSGHGTTGSTAPLPVLHARWASRSCPVPFPLPLPVPFALALRSVVRLSMLGPRGSFTDIVGSTGSSHSQHRHPSISPISSSRMTAPYPATVVAGANGSRPVKPQSQDFRAPGEAAGWRSTRRRSFAPAPCSEFVRGRPFPHATPCSERPSTCSPTSPPPVTPLSPRSTRRRRSTRSTNSPHGSPARRAISPS